MSTAQQRAADARWQGTTKAERAAATAAARRVAMERRAKAFALLRATETVLASAQTDEAPS